MKKGRPEGRPFQFPPRDEYLFDFVHHGLEGLWVVHRKVSEDFAVEFDARLGQLAHEHAVGHAVLACTCVDALDPKAGN